MIDTMRIAVAVVLIVGAGLIQGVWTSRWGPSPAQSALCARFESVPMVIGDWKGTTLEVPAADRAMAGATACLGAVYTDASTRGQRLGPAARRPSREDFHAHARRLLPGRGLHAQPTYGI